MSPATRRFYRRYQAYTVLLPVYSSAALIYGLGLMTYHPPEWLSLPKFLMPGMFLFFVCFAATEVCTHIGFMLTGLAKAEIQPTDEQRAVLKEITKPQGGLDQELLPLVVETGDVPFLAVSGFRVHQLWISAHTLRVTSKEALRYLVAHERGHLTRNVPLDRVLITGGFWWIAVVAAMLVTKAMSEQGALSSAGVLWVAAAAAAVSASIFLRIFYHLRMKQERHADRTAAANTDLQGYARALSAHLAQFEWQEGGALRRERLKGMGLPDDEVEMLIRADNS